MCGKCNLLAYELDQTAEGLAAAQEYIRSVEAARDSLRMQLDYALTDRDQKRRERDELRDELTALKRRITSHMVGQDVYWGVK